MTSPSSKVHLAIDVLMNVMNILEGDVSEHHELIEKDE